jgi:hypothetical protein
MIFFHFIHILNTNCHSPENQTSKQSTRPAINFYTISARFAITTHHIAVHQNTLTQLNFPNYTIYSLSSSWEETNTKAAKSFLAISSLTLPMPHTTQIQKKAHRQAETVSSGRFSHASDKNAGCCSTSEYLYLES